MGGCLNHGLRLRLSFSLTEKMENYAENFHLEWKDTTPEIPDAEMCLCPDLCMLNSIE